MTPFCGTIFDSIKKIVMSFETYVGLILIQNDDKFVKAYNCLVLDLVFERYVPSQITIKYFFSKISLFRKISRKSDQICN